MSCAPKHSIHTNIWLSLFASIFIWSAIEPKDQFTWFLEVVPALIGLGFLIYTRVSFPLTTLTYALILIHCIILMIGGHYTYAEVPLFDLFADWMGSRRNNYDKVGHFAQGFVPAIVAREILIRQYVISTKRWMNFLIICFCLGFSAFYELIEWWVALTSGEDAEAFLGTQGYVWDTQSDMGTALLGAIIALISLSSYHDKQLSALNGKA
jgi:putative membrane protein